jgi:cytochrome c-type biogenesis protein CcmH
MSWLPVIAIAAVAFAFAVLVLRLPKQGWALFGATLLFGLAGYAMQGDPAMPAAPKQASVEAAQSGEAMVDARRALFEGGPSRPNYLTVSDAFARQGRFDQAAQLLRKGLTENPKHGEGWLALGNALVEHADGSVTPAALNAYERAEKAMPGNPGPAYFLGLALLRSGQADEALVIWQELLDSTPQDAPWREDLASRVELLNRLIAAAQAQ